MYSFGRIFEICSDRLDRLYFKAFGTDPRDIEPRPGFDEPFSTVAFYGLVRSDDQLLANGVDGLYRLSADGRAQYIGKPKLEKRGGVWVSFVIPHVVLYFSDIQSRARSAARYR